MLWDWLKGKFSKGEGEASGIQVKKAPYTGAEAGVVAGGGTVSGVNRELAEPHPMTIATWRMMRKDPTLAFARAVATAPIRTATYSVKLAEGGKDEYKDFLKATLDPLWRNFMRNSVYGLDYGYAPFEKVYETKNDQQVLVKLKPLIAEITHVLVNRHTGEFLGVANGTRISITGGLNPAVVLLPPEKVYWYTHNREGDYWYGESVMERAREAYNSWKAVAAKAKNYHSSIVGSTPIIEYPMGTSKDKTGKDVANVELAAGVLNSLQKAVGVAMPGLQAAWLKAVAEKGLDPSKFRAWHIEMFENKTRHGPEFEMALKNLDVQKIRAWLLPERALTEGAHGTKAEAETQTATAMTNVSAIIQDIFDAINKWIVSPLLVLNFGEEARNKAKVVTETYDPRKAELLREIIRGVFGGGAARINAALFMDSFNLPAIFEILDLPLAEGYETGIEMARASVFPALAKEAAAGADDAVAEPTVQLARAAVAAAVMEHGHTHSPASSIEHRFHNLARHDGGTGYNHCVGPPANPYKLRHVTVDDELQHEISAQFAGGHGAGNKVEWYEFTKKHGKGYLLSSGEKTDVADVPKKYKEAPAA